MAIALDISEREAAERRLQQLAHYDPLTGLPNRSLLLERLKQALQFAARSERLLAVYLLDLDGFTQVNERVGHDGGDRLLRMVADRLGSGLRSAETVARLGADEFVILAQSLGSSDDVMGLAVQIREQLATPFEVSGQRFTLTGCIGISLGSGESADADSLLRQADAAMHQAKQRGGGQVQVHERSDAARNAAV